MKLKNVKLFKLNDQDQTGDTIKNFIFEKKKIPVIEHDFNKVYGISTNLRMEGNYLLIDLSIDCRKISKNKLITAAPCIIVTGFNAVKNERVISDCKLIGVTICAYHTQLELNDNLKNLDVEQKDDEDKKFVFPERIKQEAISHIKKLRKFDNLYCCSCDDDFGNSMEDNTGTQDWIKHFFNITDEEIYAYVSGDEQ